MSEDHKPLPVAGYTAQPDAKIALVNEFKADEERLLRKIDALAQPNGRQVFYGSDGRSYRDTEQAELAPDPRMLALARTNMQTAFMWLNRAIFQPQRIKLPEDVP